MCRQFTEDVCASRRQEDVGGTLIAQGRRRVELKSEVKEVRHQVCIVAEIMVRSSLNLEKKLSGLMEVAGRPREFRHHVSRLLPSRVPQLPVSVGRCLYKVIDFLLIDGIPGRQLSLIENIPLGLLTIGLRWGVVDMDVFTHLEIEMRKWSTLGTR